MKVVSPVLFLVGPTGSGKTEVSLELARRLGGEIVSADSMLVYRGMNIGTAKPGARERRTVRHYLVDLISSRRSFSVFEYRSHALKALAGISKKKKLPVVVGGSGLYLDTLWKGISDQPTGNGRLRKKYLGLVQKKGLGHLYKKLKKLNPERAAQIHPHDAQRVIRALEIAESPEKNSRGVLPKRRGSLNELGYRVLCVGIFREREELYHRINRRVESMFEKGLISEVKRLKKTGFSKTARQALGYREILRALGQKPAASNPDLIREVQTHTRHFAKRQMTWFRAKREIRWVSWNPGETCSRVCDRIESLVKEWLREWEKKKQS